MLSHITNTLKCIPPSMYWSNLNNTHCIVPRVCVCHISQGFIQFWVTVKVGVAVSCTVPPLPITTDINFVFLGVTLVLH